MCKNVTGKLELRNLKIKWNLAGPDVGSGNCCASGTHDDAPITYQNKTSRKNKLKPIPSTFDFRQVAEIKATYGSLRS